MKGFIKYNLTINKMNKKELLKECLFFKWVFNINVNLYKYNKDDLLNFYNCKKEKFKDLQWYYKDLQRVNKI